MSYEEERAARQAYQKQLQIELAKIQKKLGETAELKERKKNIDAELRSMSKGQAKVALPLIKRISVAAPCHEDWNLMKGDDRARFCGSCRETVFDLSELTESDVHALLAEHGHDICVQFYQRKDGTVMTKDCRPGVKKRRRNRVLVAGAIGLGSFGYAGWQLAAAKEPAPCVLDASPPRGDAVPQELEPYESDEAEDVEPCDVDEPEVVETEHAEPPPRRIRGRMRVRR